MRDRPGPGGLNGSNHLRERANHRAGRGGDPRPRSRLPVWRGRVRGDADLQARAVPVRAAHGPDATLGGHDQPAGSVHQRGCPRSNPADGRRVLPVAGRGRRRDGDVHPRPPDARRRLNQLRGRTRARRQRSSSSSSRRPIRPRRPTSAASTSSSSRSSAIIRAPSTRSSSRTTCSTTRSRPRRPTASAASRRSCATTGARSPSARSPTFSS